jgi:hypothetical protein
VPVVAETAQNGVMRIALGVFLICVVGVTGAWIAKGFFRAAPPPSGISVADQVREGFKQVVARMRPMLPKEIDAATTLVDVSTSGMILTYRYRVDSEHFELVPDYMRVAQGTTRALICNTEDMRAAMKAGAAYEYGYRDSNAKSLGGFVVTAADCN